MTRTKIERLYRRNLRRVGVASLWYDEMEALKASYRGQRPTLSLYPLQAARQAARRTNDRLQVSPKLRPFEPSTLEAARSLRAALEGIADEGDPVAKALCNALQYRHCHARNPFGNYFAWRDKAGLISYTPTGREVRYTDSGTWAREGRQEVTPARWARRILSPGALSKLKDEDFSAFALKFRAVESREAYAFEIVEGEEAINRAYAEVENSGSCMEGDPVGAFYAAVGASVFLCRRGGKPVGRAIAWPGERVEGLSLDTVPDFFMDRIYGDAEVTQAMLSHAKAQGWAHKARQSASCHNWVMPDGSTICGASAYISTPGGLTNERYSPYLDTFPNMDEYGDLWCHATEPDEWAREYRCTGGDYEDKSHEGKVQLANGDWVDEEEACEIDGEWYWRENCCYISRHDEYVHDDDAVYCEGSCEYERLDECYRVEIGRNTYYVHEDDVTRC